MEVDGWTSPTIHIGKEGFGTNDVALLLSEFDVVGSSNGWLTAPPDDFVLVWTIGVIGAWLADRI